MRPPPASPRAAEIFLNISNLSASQNRRIDAPS